MQTFETFEQCLTAIVDGYVAPEANLDHIAAIKAIQVTDTYEDTTRADNYFTETYGDCAGYCQNPVFAFSLPISLGRPLQTCQT